MVAKSRNWKYWLADYFSFTRWQRRGITLLLIVILATSLFRYYHGTTSRSASPADGITLLAARELVDFAADSSRNRDQEPANYRQPRTEKEETRYVLFPFDPNTATEAQWQSLGLAPRTIQTILNYRGKGGRFRSPEDLQKIYGLPPAKAAELMPYVVIAPISQPNPNTPSTQKETVEPGTRRAYTINPVDINLSDTSAWIALPGIGSKLANRIVSFRDKLGGFARIEQVAETFGLPDSTFNKIRPHLMFSSGPFRKINVNTATTDELKSHPYIRWNLANAIVNYRQQHGPYQSISDLRRIVLIEPGQLEKLEPYLSFE
jgi:DNA uptake protein ComE-like DNA-binding protein